ncbi:putative reverse transcriptase domain-containing protein [Tanacetum coccineum]
MAPKRRTTRLNPETTPAATAATTTTITNAQLQAMIDQGVTAVLASRDANTNGVYSHNSRTCARRNKRATRECTYPYFMKCQPLNFKGTEGVVKLNQWIEKMETVFRISNYSMENQIKFSTCTLLGNALTWWNSHELALLCGRMFPEESDKIEKYVGGLPDMIHGSVVASKPKTMQEATEMAIEVMDKRIRTFADRQTENKRKQDNNQQPQQQHQNKRQNTGRAYAAGTVEKKQYGGSKPLCSKCNYHHDAKCGVQGHFKRECPKLKNNNNRGNQVGGGNAPAKVYAVGHAGTNPDSNVVTGTFLLNNRYASVLFDTGADRSFISSDDDVPLWGIPLTDAYESDPKAPEAASQSPNQAPLSLANAPVYPEYLAPSDDDLEQMRLRITALISTTASLTGYSWIPVRARMLSDLRPYHHHDCMVEVGYHPTLLDPSHTCRDIIPEADMPPRKRARFAQFRRFKLERVQQALAARNLCLFARGTYSVTEPGRCRDRSDVLLLSVVSLDGKSESSSTFRSKAYAIMGIGNRNEILGYYSVIKHKNWSINRLEYELCLYTEEKISRKHDVPKQKFGGNEATKRTQKALLKQQYENFNASSSESLDSIFNRLQKLVIWMNKPDFDTMGFDDLYNNFKIVEKKVKKSTADNNDDKNLAFLTPYDMAEDEIQANMVSGNSQFSEGRRTIKSRVNNDAPIIEIVVSEADGEGPEQLKLNDKGFVDSGCSRHMSGNIAHLSDFKDFNGGYVIFIGKARRQAKVVLSDNEAFKDDSSKQGVRVKRACEKASDEVSTVEQRKSPDKKKSAIKYGKEYDMTKEMEQRGEISPLLEKSSGRDKRWRKDAEKEENQRIIRHLNQEKKVL